MRKTLLCLALAALVCLAMACLGHFYLVELCLNLVGGWAVYCSRVLPQVHLSPEGILTALFCLGWLAWGSHVLLRWLSGQLQASRQDDGEVRRPWPVRRTFALLALVVLMFVAGIAGVGVTHQTAWLANSPEPLVSGGIRIAATRTQLRNKLKQIALAMYSYSDKHGTFPPAAVWDRDGRPLLSWRVLLLPFVEEEPLYKQFHLDEPWDSPWNLHLLARLPSIYAPEYESYVPSTCRTYFQVFTGPGTAFGGRRGLNLKSDFPRGLENIIFVVESGHAVPWTKPEDLPYSASGPLPPLGYLRPEYYFNVALGDGSARTIERTEGEQTIRALITRTAPAEAPER